MPASAAPFAGITLGEWLIRSRFEVSFELLGRAFRVSFEELQGISLPATYFAPS